MKTKSVWCREYWWSQESNLQKTDWERRTTANHRIFAVMFLKHEFQVLHVEGVAHCHESRMVLLDFNDDCVSGMIIERGKRIPKQWGCNMQVYHRTLLISRLRVSVRDYNCQPKTQKKSRAWIGALGEKALCSAIMLDSKDDTRIQRLWLCPVRVRTLN